MEKKNLFSSFIDKFISLPLWLKEVLFVHLREDIAKHTLDENNTNIRKEDLFQYYVPAMTYIGKKELMDRAGGHSQNLYKFLSSALQGNNMAEITLNNYWTLEEAAILNIEAIEKEFVSPPNNTYARAMAMYLSGKIRIGEYFKRIGRINVDQLDLAIRKQKELVEAGEKIGMVTVKINMGYITEHDSRVVLYIKDECKQRFIFNPDIISKTPASASTGFTQPMGVPSEKQSEAPNLMLEKLTKENTLLKNKIRAIIDVIQSK